MTDFEIRSKLRSVYNGLSEEFQFYYPHHLNIVISNKLRCENGNIQWNNKYRFNLRDVDDVKITMSKALLNEFGWERFEQTFRHEVAHLANMLLNGRRGHGESFKRLCQKFGGTMNRKMAGSRYSDCASTEFVKKLVKWIYICPCGKKKEMARRMNKRKRNSPYYRCGRCRTNTLDTWTETRVA